jgi:Protein of unknown function (DUF3006)
MKKERHTWTVDVIEEDSAAVEVDGRRVNQLPRWLLPEKAREGDVLAVRHERTGDKSKLTIEIDPEATAAALERSKEQVRRGKPSGGQGGAGGAGASSAGSGGGARNDPGGDVAL